MDVTYLAEQRTPHTTSEHLMARPTLHSVSPRRIAEKLVDEVMRYIGPGHADREEVLEDLEEAIRREPLGDGYKMTRELEYSSSYEGSEELVDIMSKVLTIRSSLHNEDLKNWANQAGIKPLLRQNDLCLFRDSDGERKVGRITRVDVERCRYTVLERGDNGDRGPGVRSMGTYYGWEEVEPYNEVI